mgnify:CR=1 FL=1
MNAEIISQHNKDPEIEAIMNKCNNIQNLNLKNRIINFLNQNLKYYKLSLKGESIYSLLANFAGEYPMLDSEKERLEQEPDWIKRIRKEAKGLYRKLLFEIAGKYIKKPLKLLSLYKELKFEKNEIVIIHKLLVCFYKQNKIKEIELSKSQLWRLFDDATGQIQKELIKDLISLIEKGLISLSGKNGDIKTVDDFTHAGHKQIKISLSEEIIKGNSKTKYRVPIDIYDWLKEFNKHYSKSDCTYIEYLFSNSIKEWKELEKEEIVKLYGLDYLLENNEQKKLKKELEKKYELYHLIRKKQHSKSF